MDYKRNKREPHTDDYYGSLERLPLAPLKGKPPPYASRRQHDARRGSSHLQKGKEVSRSVGDLTTSNSKSKNPSSGYSLETDNSGKGDLSIPLHPKQRQSSSRDASNTPTGTSSHLHQRHGSVAYDYLQHTRESDGRKRINSTEDFLSKTNGEKYNREKQNKALQQHRHNNSNSATEGKPRTRLASLDSALEVAEEKKNGSNNNTLKNYRELAAIPDHTLVKWSRSKSMNDVTANDDDSDDDEEGHHMSPTMREGAVEYRKVVTCTSEEVSPTATSPTSSTLSSFTYVPSSRIPSYAPTHDSQEGKRSGDDEGLFVATPVFLESSPSSSPSQSPPSPLVQQDSVIPQGKQDSTDGEEDSALSTLRREILHLTRLKEEIEQNLIRSQTVLKDEVTGLREERGSLEAAMEERERRLHSKEAEIQDLKDTVKQLQTLMFTNDGEARLQRQANDLQELLREEKRHHLEETTQLRREVQRLSSRLREKDDQLAMYRSSPSLSSLGTDGLKKGSIEGWKTSLPDVRNGKVMPSLGASVAERRKSFSGMSDSSDDSCSSVGSLGRKGSRMKEDSFGGSYMAPVKSYISMESLRASNRSPPDVVRPQLSPVRSDATLEPPRKSGKAVSDASVSQVPPVKSDLAVESARKSTIETVDAPRSYLPSRDVTSRNGIDSEMHNTRDEKGRTRVRTTVYLQLGDYSKSSGSDDTHRREDYTRSGGYEGTSRAPAPSVTKSSMPSISRHSATPSTMSASSHIARPSVPPPSPPQLTRETSTGVTRPPDPPLSYQVSRSVAAPPSQSTRSSHVTKQTATPQFASAQVTKPPGQHIHPAEVGRLPGYPQTPNSPQGTEPSVRTSWMYKPVSGAGGTSSPGEEQRRGTGVSGGEPRIPQPGLRGVREGGTDLGGISYISATIQCLFTVPPLRLFFREEFSRLRVHSNVAHAVANAFRAIESGTGELRAMQCLKEAVGQRDKVFKLHQDPPAADLLSCLLVWLHNDLAPQAHPQAPLVSSVVSCLFHGMRESLIVCPRRCRVLSSALESVNYVTLSVPGEGAWSLQELLARRFCPQEMAWQCQPCGRRHPCSHETRLLRPPRVLVLYLRRPSGVVARVLFPDAGLTLHLHQHKQLHQTETLRSREYHLVGVVSHHVGEGASQYSAFCRRLEGDHWGLWEEERVTRVSRREVLSQRDAHLLFYLQQEEENYRAPAERSRRVTSGTEEGILSTFV